jgi:hypothetical protein
VSAVNLAVEDDSECKMYAALLAIALSKAEIKVLEYPLPPGYRGNVGLMLYDPTHGPLDAVLRKAEMYGSGSLIGTLPTGSGIPAEIPAILVLEKPAAPYTSFPFLGPPKDEAAPVRPQ